MNQIGNLESIWRYPVKSMRGEQIDDVFVAYTGVMGDRVYALSAADAPPEFPWHTNREQEEFVLYQPRYRNHRNTLKPAAMEAAFAEALNPPYPQASGFCENELVNRRLLIGDRLEIMLRELDPRCKSITIDPDTAETQPRILKHIARKHNGFAGVYAVVLTEGTVSAGDEIQLLD